jgi:hypothetical protein
MVGAARGYDGYASRYPRMVTSEHMACADANGASQIPGMAPVRETFFSMQRGGFLIR